MIGEEFQLVNALSKKPYCVGKILNLLGHKNGFSHYQCEIRLMNSVNGSISIKKLFREFAFRNNEVYVQNAKSNKMSLINGNFNFLNF